MHSCFQWFWGLRRGTVFYQNKRADQFESKTIGGWYSNCTSLSACWSTDHCCVCTWYWRLCPSGCTLSQVQLFVFVAKGRHIKQTKVHSYPHSVQWFAAWPNGFAGITSFPCTHWMRHHIVPGRSQQKDSTESVQGTVRTVGWSWKWRTRRW